MPLFDTLISYAKIPPHLIGPYLPVQAIPITDFVDYPLPPVGELSTTLDSSIACVTDDIPNLPLTVAVLKTKAPPPTRSIIRSLLDREPANIESAVRIGPATPRVRHKGQLKSAPLHLPLTVLDVWEVLLELHDAQKAWKRAIEHLRKVDQAYAQEALEVLARLPWGGILRGSQVSSSITSLTRYLDPTAWLSDNELAVQAAALQREVRQNGDRTTIVLEPLHTTLVLRAYRRREQEDLLSQKNYAWLGRCGGALRGETAAKLVGTVQLSGNHWIAYVIDGAERTIAIGDSLSLDVDEEVRSALLWWAGKQVASPSRPKSGSFTISHLPIARQHGTSDCGILAHNALEYYLHPDRCPLLHLPSAVYPVRVKKFLAATKQHGLTVSCSPPLYQSSLILSSLLGTTTFVRIHICTPSRVSTRVISRSKSKWHGRR